MPFVRKYLKFLKFYFSSLYNIYTAILSARASLSAICNFFEKKKYCQKSEKNTFFDNNFFSEKLQMALSDARSLNIAAQMLYNDEKYNFKNFKYFRTNATLLEISEFFLRQKFLCLMCANT